LLICLINISTYEKFSLQSCLSNGFIIGVTSLWAQQTQLPAVVPVSNYNYHDAFAPFFTVRMEHQLDPQVVSLG
jgi:hypothetical protein